MMCIGELRQHARVIDALRCVDDARVCETDVGRAIEVTVRDSELVHEQLEDMAACRGLRIDLRRSGVRERPLTTTVVLR